MCVCKELQEIPSGLTWAVFWHSLWGIPTVESRLYVALHRPITIWHQVSREQWKKMGFLNALAIFLRHTLIGLRSAAWSRNESRTCLRPQNHFPSGIFTQTVLELGSLTTCRTDERFIDPFRTRLTWFREFRGGRGWETGADAFGVIMLRWFDAVSLYPRRFIERQNGAQNRTGRKLDRLRDRLV